MAQFVNWRQTVHDVCSNIHIIDGNNVYLVISYFSRMWYLTFTSGYVAITIVSGKDTARNTFALGIVRGQHWHLGGSRVFISIIGIVGAGRYARRWVI
jgi:hypothetical protein